MKELESNVCNHKKSSLVFHKCVYVLKHRKLGDFVLTLHMFSLLLSHGQSPRADGIDSHQPSDFPKALGLLGCAIQHHPPTCGVSVPPVVFGDSICLEAPTKK